MCRITLLHSGENRLPRKRRGRDEARKRQSEIESRKKRALRRARFWHYSSNSEPTWPAHAPIANGILRLRVENYSDAAIKAQEAAVKAQQVRNPQFHNEALKQEPEARASYLTGVWDAIARQSPADLQHYSPVHAKLSTLRSAAANAPERKRSLWTRN